MKSNRRRFLAQVGEGVLAATVGYGTAVELGLTRALAGDVPERLLFGQREPLVALMQETPADELMSKLAALVKSGTTLDQLLAAGALANARTFGGEDYIGFHTFMALAPAGVMARRLPAAQAALPVLKVLHRNARRIAEHGGVASEVLRPVACEATSADRPADAQLREAVNAHDVARADRLLAAEVARSPQEAYDELLSVVADGVEVHRTVLAYRVWDLVGLVGGENATTLLRQSLHYCASNCQPNYTARFSGVRALLPTLLERKHLAEKSAGTRIADDAWIESFRMTISSSTADAAAEAIAEALAEGISHDSVAEAIALAANRLLLCDPGRPAKWTSPGKPEGSVHGDSIGLHASDSVNAWWHISRASNVRNSAASLILAGWNVAGDRAMNESHFAGRDPWPSLEARERILKRDATALLAELDDAINERDQERACAVTTVYGELGLAPEPLVDVLVRHAIADDGALHAEKYFNTATEEFGRARPAFRWRHLAGLARVCASQAGQPAPGIEEARRVLG